MKCSKPRTKLNLLDTLKFNTSCTNVNETHNLALGINYKVDKEEFYSIFQLTFLNKAGVLNNFQIIISPAFPGLTRARNPPFKAKPISQYCPDPQRNHIL